MLDQVPARRPLPQIAHGPRALSRAARLSAMSDSDDDDCHSSENGPASAGWRESGGLREIVCSQTLTANGPLKLLAVVDVDKILGRRRDGGGAGTGSGLGDGKRNVLAPGSDACEETWFSEEVFRRAQEESVANVLFKRAYLNSEGEQ